ncbi:MAG: hypothetical protein HN531_11720, partial [Opitutae bacterium]|nr:hypothetical protein [Opitutae bacterium]
LIGSQWIATGYALAMTRRESALPHGPVIARSDQREGRGNPSCLEGRLGQCGSLIGSQWIATGYALAMTRVVVSPSLFTLHSRHGLRPRDDKREPEDGIRALESCR